MKEFKGRKHRLLWERIDRGEKISITGLTPEQASARIRETLRREKRLGIELAATFAADPAKFGVKVTAKLRKRQRSA